MFNNDKDIMRVYRASVGLRTERLDAKDLPPMSAVEGTEPASDAIRGIKPGIVDQVLQLFGIKQ
jgi:hypothetical protein